MKRTLPRTPAQWLEEIRLAIADASEAEPFAPLVGTKINDANLFHFGTTGVLEVSGPKVERTKGGSSHQGCPGELHCEQRPRLGASSMMAFTLCYVAAHLALDLVDKAKAEAILTYCENHL